MRLTVMLCTLALVSCGRGTPGSYISSGGLAPTVPIDAHISPMVLPFFTVLPTTVCPTPRGFTLTTSFGLVVTPPKQTKMSLDSVTVRLIDGESLGGPSITYPRPQLAQMFGSTVVVPTSVFTFQPEFGCLVVRPQSIVAEVILLDSTGSLQTVKVSAAFE
jgi:hypothetical protein